MYNIGVCCVLDISSFHLLHVNEVNIYLKIFSLSSILVFF